MAPRGRSRRVARAEPAPELAEKAGQGAEKILLSKRCSFLMLVPEQLMPFMVAAGFGHDIQLQDFAFDAPLRSAFVERWRPKTHTFCLPWGCGIPPRSPHGWRACWRVYAGFPDPLSAAALDMAEQYLGARPPVAPNVPKESFTIKMVWLQQRLQHIPADVNADTLHQYARCYIMLFISGYLMPTRKMQLLKSPTIARTLSEVHPINTLP
ncbi:hypothetical protein PIB30_017842 [Stylosanthes scabra]|uniref:Aminotransferase-like plant mobile domain-containing protein n=1 Tax=Stylosanthes scabra TaxID=79078 RepID=A0ABU6W7W4_9FABA|nr:hypothetical protein [Stylosanthes scabra]